MNETTKPSIRPKRSTVNMGIYTVAGMLPFAIGFFMIPIYTRYMTPADYGILGLLQSLYGFLFCVAAFQLPCAIGRFFVDLEGKARKEMVFTIFASVVAVNLILLLPIHFLGEHFTNLIFPRTEITYSPYVRLVLISVFLGGLSTSCVYLLRITEAGFRFLLASLLNTFAGLGFGIYFVVIKDMGAHGAFLASTWTAAVYTLTLMMMVRGQFSLSYRPKVAWSCLKYTAPMIWKAVGTVLFRTSDRYVLIYFANLSTIGLYNVADRLASVMLVVVNAFKDAYNPVFFKMSAKNKKEAVAAFKILVTRWSAIISFLFLGLTLMCKEVLMFLTPPEYHDAYLFVPILLAAYVVKGLYNFKEYSILFAKKTFVLPLTTLAAGLFNLGANILLLPHFGMLVVAWTTLGAYLITFFIMSYFARKYYPTVFEWRKILTFFGVAVVSILVDMRWAPKELVPEILFQAGLIVLFGLFIYLTGWGGIRSYVHLVLTRVRGFIRGKN